jgi:hypothetical protein
VKRLKLHGGSQSLFVDEDFGVYKPNKSVKVNADKWKESASLESKVAEIYKRWYVFNLQFVTVTRLIYNTYIQVCKTKCIVI